VPPVPTADAGLLVTLATLLGQQPKFDTIVGNPPLVQGADGLSSWVQPSWTADDANQAPAPPGTEFLPASELGNFFAKPGPLPTLPPQ